MTRIAEIRPLTSAVSFLEAIGRTIMDFGFNGIKTFEEYIGRRATKGLAILIGMALAAFSMNIIWLNVVEPLLLFFQTPVWGRKVGNVAWLAVTLGGGIALSFAITNDLLGRQMIKKARRNLSASRDLMSDTRAAVVDNLDQSRQVMTEAKADAERTKDTLQTASQLLEILVTLSPIVSDDLRVRMLDILRKDGPTEEAQAELRAWYEANQAKAR